MLYAVFRIAVAGENIADPPAQLLDCHYDAIEIVHFSLLLIYLPMQAYFVFKYGRIYSMRRQILAGFALSHILASNFICFFEMFVVETQRFKVKSVKATYDYFENFNFNTNSTNSTCFNDVNSRVEVIASQAAPFLYPLTTHFLLLSSVVILRLLQAFSRQDEDNGKVRKVPSSVKLNSLEKYEHHHGPCDCHQSNKGLFLNLIVLVVPISLILVAHFLTHQHNKATMAESELNFHQEHPTQTATVRLAYYTAQITINSLVIVALPFLWCNVQKLDRVPNRDTSIDVNRSIGQYKTSRNIITLICLLLSSVYSIAIIVGHCFVLSRLVIDYIDGSNVEPYYETVNTLYPAIAASALAIGRSLSLLILSSSLVIVAMLTDCRSALTEELLQRKPGRSLIMFILTASLVIWGLEVAFEFQSSIAADYLTVFSTIFNVGPNIWPLLACFSVPLSVGFKLLIAIWFYDNWTNCYTPTVI